MERHSLCLICGSGVFVSPGGVLHYAGSPAAAIIIWASCGVFCTLGAICFSHPYIHSVVQGCSFRQPVHGGLHSLEQPQMASSGNFLEMAALKMCWCSASLLGDMIKVPTLVEEEMQACSITCCVLIHNTIELHHKLMEDGESSQKKHFGAEESLPSVGVTWDSGVTQTLPELIRHVFIGLPWCLLLLSTLLLAHATFCMLTAVLQF
ncbi:L-type amino acid transporter 1-like protein MLAS-like [Homarus americanus]|uniref:L-type amino acid transporter 1-like protein MLAS-like n=1 Tax=Homarus americanus TaxID=6706 RepID=A0A8J5JJT4_HOMAM|nr:L-type amino acid transporter 1-like protein MLAS-like [Homarus americanus]